MCDNNFRQRRDRCKCRDRCRDPCRRRDPCNDLFPCRRPISFNAFLNGSNEVPANNSAATGTLLARLSSDETRLDFTLITIGLVNIVAAHFHNAPAGVNGPIVKDIAISPVTGQAVGVWTSNDLLQPLTPALVQQLKLGNIYVNVHTALLPGGEIRGQVLRVFINSCQF